MRRDLMSTAQKSRSDRGLGQQRVTDYAGVPMVCTLYGIFISAEQHVAIV